MKQTPVVATTDPTPAKPPDSADILPISIDYPGDAYLRGEITRNRKKERWLVLYGAISLLLVAILVTIRVVYF